MPDPNGLEFSHGYKEALSGVDRQETGRHRSGRQGRRHVLDVGSDNKLSKPARVTFHRSYVLSIRYLVPQCGTAMICLRVFLKSN